MGRRRDDRDNAQAAEHNTRIRPRMIKLLWWVVCIQALVIGVLIWQTLRDHSATTHATAAANKADAALTLAASALLDIRREAEGLCNAQATTITYVDDAHKVLHRAFLDASQLFAQQARGLSHGISRGVRHAGALEEFLAVSYANYAKAIKKLQPVDCVQLTRHPRHYSTPRPQPYHP